MKKLIPTLVLVSFVSFFIPNNVFGFGLCDGSTQTNLFVSSQNSQSLNHFAGPQIIQVAVCDPSIQATDEALGEPDVTVNGKKLRMVQSSDGSWYAFFADRAMAQLADSTTSVVGRGLDFGRFCSSSTQQNVTGISLSETSGFALPRDGSSGSNGQSSMNTCTSIGSGTTISNHVIRNPPSLNSAAPQTGQIGILSDAWPLIQLYDFTPTGNVIVTYNKGGGSQTLSSPFDISGTATISVESSTTLDPATNVPIKISDFQLNIDPTSKDSWTLGTSTAIPKVYYQLFSGDSVDGDGKGLADLKSSLSGMMFENNGYLTVDNTNSILEIKDNSDQVLIAYGNQLGTSSIGPGEFPVTITEQSANVGVFANWDSQNNANIKTVANNAQLASKTVTISYNAIAKTIQYNLPAPVQNPTITLSPTSSLAGTQVAISGSGFPPSTVIPVAFDGTTLNSFTSSATGTFSGDILIPNFSTAGTHSVQAAPGTAYSASATFTVTVATQTVSEEEQRHKEAYDGLPQKFEDKVEPPVIEDYTNVQKPAKVSEPKQDTKIFEIAKSPNPQQYAINSGLDYKDGKVRLVITANPTEATLNKIKQIATVESVAGNQIQLAVDVKKIGDLTKLTEVSSLRAPAKVVQSGTTSEGVEFVNAHKVQTKGTTGKGVKVAVLDLGFDTKNAELGAGLQTKSFRKDFGKAVDIKGFGYEYVHGTAVAEIIKDIAPGVHLYLYTFGTEAEFNEAMSEAIKQSVDIISMSAGWLNYPSDGSSAMTKKVEEAIKKGIPFIVSSGNYAETHWEGKYSDTVKNGWHEFSGKDEGLSIEVDTARVNAKAPIVIYVMWDSKSGVYDFDLTLTDTGGKKVSSSTNVQKAKTDAMYEYIFYTPIAAGTYSLGISYSGTSAPNTTIEVFSPTDMLEYTTAKGSVSVPNDAEGIISVGAIHFLYAELEPFSSQGPANNGKSVPNVVAPDAVATVAYGGEPFYGTSAAQPHVTGIAALLLEKNPNLTPVDIKKYLQDKADKAIVGIKSADNVYGSGKADALFITNTEIKATQSSATSSTKTTTPSTAPPRTGSTKQQGVDSEISIPGWIKSNARWWYDGTISDQDFAKGIEFMIKEGIIHIPATEKSDKKEANIPSWVKQNAKWWVDDIITDKDFAVGIQYLVKSGIISVGSGS